MKVKGSKAGWGFWLGWVVASTVGMLVGFMMMFFIAVLMSELIDIEWLGDLVGGIILGIGVGVSQWIVLRRRLTGAGWWVLASAGAGAVIFLTRQTGYPESLSFGTLLRYAVVMALSGAVAGILQWLVLRGKVSRAGWWVLASTLGWGLGMTVSEVIPWTGDAYFEFMAVTGAVMGAVTGGALVWLLRQPVPEAQLE